MEELPKEIQTEYGTTLVKQAKLAWKNYKCPLCFYELDLLEDNILLIPKYFPDKRRHVHELCLKLFIENEWTIRLLP